MAQNRWRKPSFCCLCVVWVLKMGIDNQSKLIYNKDMTSGTFLLLYVCFIYFLLPKML